MATFPELEAIAAALAEGVSQLSRIASAIEALATAPPPDDDPIIEDPPTDPIIDDPIIEDPTPDPPPAFSLADFAVGDNLFEPTYYGAQWLFEDHYRQGAGRHSWGTIAPTYAGGDLTIEWEGPGTIPEGVSDGPNRRLVRATARDSQLILRPSGEVHTIRVTSPAPTRAGFQAIALERLAPMRALRFMQWSEINESLQGNLLHPYAVMLDLCAAAGCIPWFCLPTARPDPEGLLAAIEAHTYGGPVIVEWSNETWNGGFTQFAHAAAAGRAAGIAGEDNPVNAIYTVRETHRLEQILRPALGARLHMVLASHLVQTWRADRMIEEVARLGARVDGFAVAAYYLEPGAAAVDQTLGEARTMRDLVAPIPLVAYEAGQHFGARNAASHVAADYRRLFEGWRNLGCGLICHYTHCSDTRGGAGWPGALERQDQAIAGAPKYAALIAAAGV